VDGVHAQQQEQRREFELTGNPEHAPKIAFSAAACN
jgi:hypothetical protein